MGQKDLAHGDYFDDMDRFADACNGILFQGEQVVKAKDLQNTESEIIYSENGKYRKVIPDKIRVWHGIHIAIITLENQTNVDYKMVFRVMKSEAAAYEKQWKDRECQLRKEGKLGSKQLLCWYGKEQMFIPVVTIVIYLGRKKEWDGATCLYDMLLLDRKMKPFVSNFRLNLFDYHNYDDFSQFQTENRELFEFLSCANNKNKMRKKMEDNPRYREMDSNAAWAISKIAGINIKIEKDRKGIIDMCKAWDDWREDGRRQGRREGKKEGKKETTLQLINNVMDSLDLTVVQAMDILKISEKEQKKYLKILS